MIQIVVRRVLSQQGFSSIIPLVGLLLVLIVLVGTTQLKPGVTENRSRASEETTTKSGQVIIKSPVATQSAQPLPTR